MTDFSAVQRFEGSLTLRKYIRPRLDNIHTYRIKVKLANYASDLERWEKVGTTGKDEWKRHVWRHHASDEKGNQYLTVISPFTYVDNLDEFILLVCKITME